MKAIESSLPLVCIGGTAHIDALPYADESELMAAATQLIEEERKLLPTKDYLADLPPPPTSDLSHYVLKRTSDKAKREPSSLAQSQLVYGYKQIQSLNLDLLSEYGTEAWTLHLRALESYKLRLETTVKALQESKEKINAERMHSQLRGKEMLKTLHEQWKVLCHKTRALYKESERLETLISARNKKRAL